MKIPAILKTVSTFLRSSWMTCLVIALALSFPLSAYVFSKNIQSVASYLKTTNTIILYLSKDNTPAQNNDLLAALKSNPMIDNSRYISPDEGLKELQADGHFGNILDTLPQNPLPAAIITQISDSVQTTDQANQLFMQLKQWPGVASATMDPVWLQRLNALLSLGHRIHVALLCFFSAAAILIVGYTMHLSRNNYQQGTELLKTFGAETISIQWPFLLYGIIYGLMGCLLAWLIVGGLIFWIREPFMELSRLYGNTFALQGLTAQAIALLFITGIASSLAGAWISVRYSMK